MLFSMLYEAVYVQVDSVLTDREANETKKAVRDGLNMVMENSEQFHPPFIGSLQVLISIVPRPHPRFLMFSRFSVFKKKKKTLKSWGKGRYIV